MFKPIHIIDTLLTMNWFIKMPINHMWIINGFMIDFMHICEIKWILIKLPKCETLFQSNRPLKLLIKSYWWLNQYSTCVTILSILIKHVWNIAECFFDWNDINKTSNNNLVGCYVHRWKQWTMVKHPKCMKQYYENWHIIALINL